MRLTFKQATRVAAGLGLGIWAVAAPAQAQPSWIMPDILAAAKAEGELTIYASMNEEEALPYWRVFEDATGIKVSFVRSSDANIRARIAIEARARQRSWDLVATTPVYNLPDELLLQFDPPEARNLIAEARGPNRRWYGVTGNYNSPAYNTNFVKKAELPQTYEDFLAHKEWAGKIAIDATDSEWLTGIFQHYGDERGRKLAQDIAATLKPVVVDGHLNIARSVGAGEYWIALNNFVPLTVNMKLSGAATDFWALDPVTLAFGSVGISAQAPHPKASLLAANYMLSREGQQFLTLKGRLPTRRDVETNPPGIIDVLQQKKVIAPISSAEERKRMQTAFNEIFRPR
ncbi:MAG TPA: ABC transporter substrate-binding protein [Xanthobacteraceae bacterium]